MSWKEILTARLPLYGHRNWIVVADSAYPAQSNAGIETIVSGEELTAVLEHVLGSLSGSKHVKPVIYTDRELEFVSERAAPGVSAYLSRLKELLQGRQVNTLPHEEIIRKLDQAGAMFRVLIVKTNMTIPYTSIFLELDCAYWTAEAERSLRKAFEAHSTQ